MRPGAVLLTFACLVAAPVRAQEPAHDLVALAGVTSLAPFVTGPLAEEAPSPSPDGRTLVFTSRALGVHDAHAVLERVDVSAPTARTTVSARATSAFDSPVWAASGATLTYREVLHDEDVRRTVHVLDEDIETQASSAAILRILRSPPPRGSLRGSIWLGDDRLAPWLTPGAVLPDGRVVGAAQLRGEWHVVIVDGAGRVDDRGLGASPSASPDGRTFAFVRYVDGVGQIFVASTSGGDALQLTHDDFDALEPSFSPDGSKLVFVSRRSIRADRLLAAVWNVFVMGVDGSGLVALTDGDAVTGGPRWAPDGWIYFSSNALGTLDIWRLRLVGAGVPVTPATGGIRVRLTVEHADGVRLRAGTTTELTVSRRAVGRRIACVAHVVLDGNVLFGETPAAGSFRCSAFATAPPQIVGQDTEPTSEDGDAAFSLDTDGQTFSIDDDADGKHGPLHVRGRAELL